MKRNHRHYRIRTGFSLGLFITAGIIFTVGGSGCRGDHQVGLASYYNSSLAGEKTASGEPYDPRDLTAAHRNLPFGAKVRVTNLQNDRSVTVRINDRGPAVERRIIDLSLRAARNIQMLKAGVVRVKVEVVDKPVDSG